MEAKRCFHGCGVLWPIPGALDVEGFDLLEEQAIASCWAASYCRFVEGGLPFKRIIESCQHRGEERYQIRWDENGCTTSEETRPIY